MANWTLIDKHAKAWLQEAGKRIVSSFATSPEIMTKTNPNDLVTNVDQDTEQFFTQKIREAFPEHRILGEEGFGDEPAELSGIIWIIDPIDGTTNFVHQQRNFMISIGIYENGEPRLGFVYDAVYEELYHARAGEGAYWNDKKLPKLEQLPVEKALIGINSTWLISNRLIDPEETLIPLVKDARGTRSYGSAALEFIYVATGRLDAYITMRLSPWDFAGGKIIVEEVGGKVTNLKGEPLKMLERNPIVVARPGLHETIIQKYLSKGR